LQADDFLPGIIIKDLNLSTFFSSIYSFLFPCLLYCIFNSIHFLFLFLAFCFNSGLPAFLPKKVLISHRFINWGLPVSNETVISSALTAISPAGKMLPL